MKKITKNESDDKFRLLSKNWSINNNILFAKFNFKSFDEAFDFMKTVSEKCKDLNHHPKWTNVYNQINVELFTHDIGGLSPLDFELANFMDLSFLPYSQ